MAPATQVSIGKTLVAAVLIAGVLLGFAAPAAATPEWVRNALAGLKGDREATPPTPTVGRFAIDGGGGFVLDRSHHPALLKFDDSGEIWALTPSRGPRGDIIYKNDVGDPLLRATRLGGMTVYTAVRPEGAAASLSSAASPFHLSPVGPDPLYRALLYNSGRCSRGAHHLVGFEAPEADPRSAGLIADAAAIAAEAFLELALKPGGKVTQTHIMRMAFVTGSRAGVTTSRGTLTITVAPSQGYGGRPSSARILQALEVE